MANKLEGWQDGKLACRRAGKNAMNHKAKAKNILGESVLGWAEVGGPVGYGGNGGSGGVGGSGGSAAGG
uniref:GG12194 n=1 Tax=Drosophila erecta TaxID=7220 RepID=B3P687_DROER